MYHVIHCTHVCLLLVNCWYLPSALTVSRQTWHVTWPFYPEYCAWKRQNCQVWQLDRFLGKTCSYNLHYYIAEWELTTCCVLAMFHFRVFLRSFHSKKKKKERGQSYSGFISHQPFLTLLCNLLADSGSLDSVGPSCSSSWPTGRSLFQKLCLVLFLYFISCLKRILNMLSISI